MDAPPPNQSRILTVPNLVTTIRLACVPWFLWLLFGKDDRTAAAWLIAVLGCTDWVDGFLARRLNQVSELGKVLDPVADRIMMVTVVISLMVDGSVPLVVGLGLLGRELLVSVAVLVLAVAGAARVDVQWVGKAGTLALMVALPLFMMHEPWGFAAEFISWGFAVPGLILLWYSCWTYVPLAKTALAQGRADRPGTLAP